MYLPWMLYIVIAKIIKINLFTTNALYFTSKSVIFMEKVYIKFFFDFAIG